MDRSSFFIAMKPPCRVAREIGWWRDSARSGARPVRDELLHITLCHLGLFPVSNDPVADVRKALRGFAAAPCRVVFDLLTGGSGSGLLASSERLERLMGLQSRIASRLRQSGLLPSRAYRFSPHVTLFYDRAFSGSSPIDPISWTVYEIILVESVIGQGRHISHQSWPLVGEAGKA